MMPVRETTLLATTISAGLGTPARLRVRSVHRAAINLVATDGSLVTIADARVRALPGGILVGHGTDLRAVGVAPGMSASLSADRCTVGSGALTVELAEAVAWDPHLPRLDAAAWPGRSVRAHALARQVLADGSIALEPDGAAMLGDLGAAIGAGDARRTTAAAERLVGRGPGLTPSGDDALTGIAAALHATGHPSLEALIAAFHDLDDRTTFVAAAMLRHAAAGAFAERIHRLVRALLAPSDAGLDTALHEAVAWGATSGSDLLSGVLVGMDAAIRRLIGEVAA